MYSNFLIKRGHCLKMIHYDVHDNIHVERGDCHGSNHTNEFKKEFI